MHYYVDGYNLIFRTLAAGESLQQRREILISELNAKAERLNLSITVVFDSHYQKNEATLHHYRSLEIIYTNEKETADDYIIKALKHQTNIRQVTVVTSDQHLAWRARREGAQTETAEQYLSSLQKRYRNRVQQEKRESSAPPIQKINLPKLLADPKEKSTETKIQSDFDNKEENPQTPAKGAENKYFYPKQKTLNPQQYESDYDRWLREFDK